MLINFPYLCINPLLLLSEQFSWHSPAFQHKEEFVQAVASALFAVGPDILIKN